MGGRGMATKNRAPGPGMYTTCGSMEIENGHIFGTSTRKDAKDLMGNPGPGQYEASNVGKGGGVTLKSRNKFGDFLPTKYGPGPGQYENRPQSSHGGSKIGTGQRSNFTGGKDITPGPGQHNATEYDIRS